MVAKVATRGEEGQRARGLKLNKLEFWQKKKKKKLLSLHALIPKQNKAKENNFFQMNRKKNIKSSKINNTNRSEIDILRI